MNTRKPTPCPHGVAGWYNCRPCRAEYIRTRNERIRAEKLAAGWVPKTTGGLLLPCPHGVMGKGNCLDCRREYGRMQGQRWRARKRDEGIAATGRVPDGKRLCPHGNWGRSTCPACGREKSLRYSTKQRAALVAAGIVIKTTKGPAPRACPHGVVGVNNCRTCVNDRANVLREQKRAEKRAAGWRPWAVTRKPCRHGFARKSDCITCLRDAAILFKTRRRLQPGTKMDMGVTLSAVIERGGGACHWCGRAVYTERDRASRERADAATIDHLVPLVHRGDHVWANVVLSCRACNTEKLDDVCERCGGPITELGEPICSTCLAKGRGPKQRLAVCAHCGYVQMDSGWCDRCKAKGPDIWAATDLTRVKAYALSRSLGFEPKGLRLPATTDWVVWMVA